MNPIEARIEEFKSRLLDELGDKVECMVLTGSHARDDARPDSDIDIWVFLSEIDVSDLKGIGRIVRSMGDGPEINPQCTTFDEVQGRGFAKAFSPVQLRLGGKILHGDLGVPAPTREQVRAEIAELAAFVVMSARHYLTVQEPQIALRAKLNRFVLKPLVWALRYDVYVRTGRYPPSRSQLEEHLIDAKVGALVDAYYETLVSEYKGDCAEVLEQAMQIAQPLMNAF